MVYCCKIKMFFKYVGSLFLLDISLLSTAARGHYVQGFSQLGIQIPFCHLTMQCKQYLRPIYSGVVDH